MAIAIHKKTSCWSDPRRPVLGPWIRFAEVRVERRYEKWNTAFNSHSGVVQMV